MMLYRRLIEWDKRFFLYLNGKHYDWLDPIMLGLSSFLSWILVCALIVVVMIYKAKSNKLLAPFFILLSIGINSLINNGIKIFIGRPRPIHRDAWHDIIHAIEEYETSYSFFSAHSSNSFCLAVFSLMFFKNKLYSYAILIWATVVAYSRIYLGKHYPFDVLCGIGFGIIMGFVGYKIYEYYNKKRSPLPS